MAMRRELRASRGVRLSNSRLSFSSREGLVRRLLNKEGYVCVQGVLTSLLPSLAVRVLATADDDRVDGYEDREDARKGRLHGDEHDTGDRLRGFGDAERFDENEDADDGEDAHDLDDDVDPVPGCRRIWPPPQQQDEHEGFDDQLPGCLRQAVAVSTSDDAAAGEHVDDDGHEEPPVPLLVGVVEKTVFDPGLLMLEQGRGVTFHFLELPRDGPDADCEEGEDGGEYGEGYAGEDFGGPRIAVGELVHAVDGPDAVEEED